MQQAETGCAQGRMLHLFLPLCTQCCRSCAVLAVLLLPAPPQAAAPCLHPGTQAALAPAGVYFGTLLGMADHLAFTLGPAGYNPYKMVPYGPVQAVTKYLLRRAQENSSVLGGAPRWATLGPVLHATHMPRLPPAPPAV